MANQKGINPANSGDANARAVEANVHRLDRSPSIANERPGTAEAEMPRPEDRKPEALPAGEPYGRQVAPSAPAPKKSMRRPQVNHATIASHVTAFNHAFDNSTVLQAWSPWTAGGRAVLDQVIQMQASIISYIDDFKLMMILSLAAIPPVLLLRSAPPAEGSDHAMVME